MQWLLRKYFHSLLIHNKLTKMCQSFIYCNALEFSLSLKPWGWTLSHWTLKIQRTIWDISRNCGWSITMIMLRLTYFTHSSIQTGCKSLMTWQTWPKVDLDRKLILASSSSSTSSSRSSVSRWNWKGAPGWLLAFRLGLAREFIKFETIWFSERKQLWWFLWWNHSMASVQPEIYTEGSSNTALSN